MEQGIEEGKELELLTPSARKYAKDLNKFKSAQ